MGNRYNRLELTGKTFGKLTVLRFAHIRKGHSEWLMRCDCGTEKIIDGSRAAKGLVLSCGCLRRIYRGVGAVKRTHGMANKSPLYAAWLNMKTRCNNPNTPDYRNYGGRGIIVWPEWQVSFEAFLRDMGPTWQRGLSLDRIDTNGNYEPANCRWIPNEDQWKTRRSHGNIRADDPRREPSPARHDQTMEQ